ncbi:MAG: YbaN family protein [Rhodobacteraceae bacterium]|nr:YbaN family protein [Paracoccaceae bacterium]
MRIFWLAAGLLSVAIGVIGIFLPILPTVPFMILAAFCFSESSPRLHAWLLSHPVYGPHIRDWRERGAIRLGAKRLATASILASILLSLLLRVPPPALAIQGIALTAALAFIWSRPSE